MALTLTNFQHYFHNNSGFSSQGGDPFVTSSFTPADDCLLLIHVQSTTNPSFEADDFVVSGGGLTWNRVISEELEFVPGEDTGMLQVWYAEVETSPGSMAVTVTHTGVFAYTLNVFLHEFDGYDVDQPIGEIAYVEAETNTVTATLTNPTGVNSIVVGHMSSITTDQNGTNVTIAPVSPFTEAFDSVVTDSFNRNQIQRYQGATSVCEWSTTHLDSGSAFDTRRATVVEIREATADVILDAEGTTFAVAFTAVDLQPGAVIDADASTFALSFTAVSLDVPFIDAGGAVFSLSFTDVSLEPSGLILEAGGMTFTSSFTDVILQADDRWVSEAPITTTWVPE